MQPRANRQEYKAMCFAELIDAYLQEHMRPEDVDNPERLAELEREAWEHARELMTEHPSLSVGERQ